MKNIVKAIGAAAMVGVIGLGVAAPAEAAPWGWHRHYYHRYHPGPAYYPGYYPYYDPGAAVAAGIIGGIFGTIAGTAIHAGTSHAWRCAHTYRSYVPATNTYRGYDGRTHACRL